MARSIALIFIRNKNSRFIYKMDSNLESSAILWCCIAIQIVISGAVQIKDGTWNVFGLISFILQECLCANTSPNLSTKGYWKNLKRAHWASYFQTMVRKIAINHWEIVFLHTFFCGEYGWVLWASWPRREPRNAGVITDQSRSTGHHWWPANVGSARWNLLLPAAVSR